MILKGHYHEHHVINCMNVKISLTLKEIIVGVNGKNYEFLNYCIWVGKSTIYQCRRRNIMPNIQLFKVNLNYKYESELLIAQKNNTLDKFKNKWKFKALT